MVRAAQALVLALVLLALVRAGTLELDPYDSYEVRTSARAVAGDSSSPFLIYRSALLTLAEAPLERWARGSRATWVFPHVLTALASGGLALAAVALARAAGASREASWAAGAAVALDRLAFADAPLGLPDGLSAALATLGLARGLALLESPKLTRALEAGAILGLAAAARPNAGLACGALALAALGADLAARPLPSWRRSRFAAALLAGATATLVYFALATLVFSLGRGSLAAGLAAHRDLATFQREQFAENARKYGALFPPLALYTRAVFFMEPATALLWPFALAFTSRREIWRALTLACVAASHLAALCLLVGHGEARYLLPALPPLAALAALGLDAGAARLRARLASDLARRRARLGFAALWVLVPLALGARFEAESATDPTLRHDFSQRVADEVAALSSSTTRVLWTPDFPFPVYPEVLAREGTPFRGDPFHGISHAGPVTVGYHLATRSGGPAISLLRRAEGEGAGVSTPEGLEAMARGGTLRAGDVVLLGASAPGLTWALARERPVMRVLEVVRTPDGLRVVERARVGP